MDFFCKIISIISYFFQFLHCVSECWFVFVWVQFLWRHGHWILWNWSDGWLWISEWVLGNKLGSSARALCAVSRWAISLPSPSIVFISWYSLKKSQAGNCSSTVGSSHMPVSCVLKCVRRTWLVWRVICLVWSPGTCILKQIPYIRSLWILYNKKSQTGWLN